MKNRNIIVAGINEREGNADTRTRGFYFSINKVYQ